MNIKSAEFVRYNANDRGNNAPDCVKRAISMAFSIPYSQVSKDLRAAQSEVRRERHNINYEWNMPTVYERVIRAYGGSERIQPDNKNMTLEEFADSHDGTYIVATGRSSKGSNHLVCMVDGEVFDSWNSLDQIVIRYYKVEGPHKPKSDIKDRFPDLISYASELIDKSVQFRLAKFGLADAFTHEDTTDNVRGFAFQIHYYLQSNEFDNYLAEVVITYALSPTTTYDEAIEYINKITPTRVYDRLYAIRDRLKDLREAEAYSEDLPDNAGHIYIASGLEERFYRTLPEWLKRRLTYLHVYEPGNYTNSYNIEFVPLPGDTDKSKVEFEGATADEVKDRIKRYKNNNFDRDWYDY